MKHWRDLEGMTLFLILLAVVIVGSFIAFIETGSMGMEERFSHAVGLPHEDEHRDEGVSWFSLEGNPILYVIILCVLGITCILAYKYGKI
jgi:hypothetical protein